ncbi:MAG: glycosyltransferase [Candidatus Omnitrophica bacterium]|nr:glycosyltransferase [Candidatus Omnitrophota bacterium]
MKVSIITDVLNSENTLEESILSVLNQDYENIEYIIVDGWSTDGTLKIIDKYMKGISKFISEPDKNHFDAMNKGIRLASGDIIGFLHADDIFADNFVIRKIAEEFIRKDIDCVWGDLLYVDKEDTDKIVRWWKSSEYKKDLFRKGWMPAHPTFFVKREVYEKHGNFNLDLPIAGDYEIMLRFLYKCGIKGSYIPEVLVKMRLGGLSNQNLKNIIQKSGEDLKAWQINGFSRSLGTLFLKNISKVSQFFVK